MKHRIRVLGMWFGIALTAVCAFFLAVNITSDSLDNSFTDEDIVIDLNEDPYEAGTTEEASFWERYMKYSTSIVTPDDNTKENPLSSTASQETTTEEAQSQKTQKKE